MDCSPICPRVFSFEGARSWAYNGGTRAAHLARLSFFMQRPVYAGIDIGTYHVKVVIATPSDSPAGGLELPLNIIGTGTSSSKGLRHGYIIDKKEATRSIREAL